MADQVRGAGVRSLTALRETVRSLHGWRLRAAARAESWLGLRSSKAARSSCVIFSGAVMAFRAPLLYRPQRGDRSRREIAHCETPLYASLAVDVRVRGTGGAQHRQSPKTEIDA